jgi:hypothetical protein
VTEPVAARFNSPSGHRILAGQGVILNQGEIDLLPWRDYDAWEARDRTLLEAASLARDRHLRYPPSPPTTEPDA